MQATEMGLAESGDNHADRPGSNKTACGSDGSTAPDVTQRVCIPWHFCCSTPSAHRTVAGAVARDCFAISWQHELAGAGDLSAEHPLEQHEPTFWHVFARARSFQPR